jgi:hypothetical protein
MNHHKFFFIFFPLPSNVTNQLPLTACFLYFSSPDVKKKIRLLVTTHLSVLMIRQGCWKSFIAETSQRNLPEMEVPESLPFLEWR